MEYFDFEEASVALHKHELPSPAPISPDASWASGLRPSPDTLSVPNRVTNPGDADTCGQAGQAGRADELSGMADLSVSAPSYSQPANPCDYCRSHRFECFFICKERTACTICSTMGIRCSLAVGPDRVTKLGSRRISSLDYACTLEGELAETGSSKDRDGSEPMSGRAGKHGARLSRDSVRILKRWLADHASHPYPTEEEKDQLKQRTGLKISQISNWLANARRRGKVSPVSGQANGGNGIQATAPVPIPGPHAPLEAQDMTPLERWRHSPPEHEPASVTAIADAVATSTWPFDQYASVSEHATDHQRDSSAGSSMGSAFFRAPSLSSQETRFSSGSDYSFASAFSNQSQSSLGSLLNGKKNHERRRRRRPTTHRTTDSQHARMFQCTFCTDSFKTKHDWQRHEKSLHLSLERWVCAPHGGSVAMPDGPFLCAFCQAPNPSEDHLETHNYSQCQDKGLSERTFYRKDHVRQHLRLTHGLNIDVDMDTWKCSTDEVQSRCGFCQASFHTWHARVDHLAAHFRAGAQMADWKGDWGFEPAVMASLQSDMPPWLIDQERRSLNPFRASQHPTPAPYEADPTFLSCGFDPADLPTQDSYCYKRLEKLLAAWVRDQIAQRVVPSDEMLQDQARLIVFREADSWNQTAADNAEWLARFKQSYGLMPDGGGSLPTHELQLLPQPLSPSEDPAPRYAGFTGGGGSGSNDAL
ncbi:MAG: hypothetical protein M1838_000374 [Thelocarpon superellum]|nr:MAG: hypothetical protein M1838_000374 [Thelocarpon superellum]